MAITVTTYINEEGNAVYCKSDVFAELETKANIIVIEDPVADARNKARGEFVSLLTSIYGSDVLEDVNFIDN